jgi:spore coat protein U-like protein
MRRASINHGLLAFVMASALGLATTAWASTRTTTFTVSLLLQNDCQIATSQLDFGTTGLIGTNLDQTSSLSITCSAGAPYNIALDAGSVPGSAVSNRLLGGIGLPTPTVGYQIYRDSARSLIWGETIGTDTFSGTGTGSAQALTMYGRIMPQGTPIAGAYSSVVTATVTF